MDPIPLDALKRFYLAAYVMGNVPAESSIYTATEIGIGGKAVIGVADARAALGAAADFARAATRAAADRKAAAREAALLATTVTGRRAANARYAVADTQYKRAVAHLSADHADALRDRRPDRAVLPCGGLLMSDEATYTGRPLYELNDAPADQWPHTQETCCESKISGDFIDQPDDPDDVETIADAQRLHHIAREAYYEPSQTHDVNRDCLRRVGDLIRDVYDDL